MARSPACTPRASRWRRRPGPRGPASSRAWRASPGLALRVRVRPDERRLVELERIPLRIPQEAELAPRRPNDGFVANIRGLQPLHRERQVVDDDLRHDTAAPEVLRFRGGVATGDQREARPLRGVESDELRRPVEEPHADDVPVELELGLDVLDEDQRAADLADVAERLDGRHVAEGTTRRLAYAAPQPSSRRT